MNYQSDWSWKDPNKPKEKWEPKIKKEEKKKKRKAKKKNNRKKYLTRGSSDDFYKSPEWRKLRYRVLKKYGANCMCCGQNYKDDGVKMHVDHIKPRSKYPHLALVFDNLQVLCEECNLGKSNVDETDWRPFDTHEPEVSEEWAEEQVELSILKEANKHL